MDKGKETPEKFQCPSCRLLIPEKPHGPECEFKMERPTQEQIDGWATSRWVESISYSARWRNIKIEAWAREHGISRDSAAIVVGLEGLCHYINALRPNQEMVENYRAVIQQMKKDLDEFKESETWKGEED